MAKGIHTGKTSNTAADGGNRQQSGFRDPPEVPAGFLFIHKHKQKACSIDYKEIESNQFCHWKNLSGGMELKRLVWPMLLMSLLCGCRAEETLETVNDEWVVPAMAQPREISVRLPEDAVSPVLEQEGRQIYMGLGYEIMLETMESGDLNKTLRTLSGYDPQQLTVVETSQDGAKRYDFVWTTTGESGSRLGRGAILDDGSYHYCMTALRDAGDTQIPWRDLFGSFALI